ncbi:MatE_and transmembrane domain-containing protein [Hexamita inflata]|uniref:MatE and transmembrane domain-containing protein n=1 Tax=Hexamita inflata TaxID=28002 RepID=A0AA86QLR8_9EUKA|nr:MatE and transmembrane domain-containing protein [Hexamita inflata]
MIEKSAYSDSISSAISSMNKINFKTILLDPIGRVVHQTTIVPIISHLVQSFCAIIILVLAYYYSGYKSVGVITVTQSIIQLYQMFISSPEYGVLRMVQQRLMAEQKSAANIIFQHVFTVSLILGIIVLCISVAISDRISNYFLSWCSETTYLTLMIQGMPLLLAIQSPYILMTTENQSNYSSFFEMFRSVLVLIVIFITIIVQQVYSIKSDLKTFAIVELIINAIFALVMLFVVTLNNKFSTDISNFKLTLIGLRDQKMGIIWVVVKKSLFHLLISITDVLIPILSIIINLQQQENNIKVGNFVAFSFFVTYQDICNSIAYASKAIILQIFLPNIQMKRYERIAGLMGQGFGYIILLSTIMNIILFVICNQILTIVFYDVKYNELNMIFTESQYSVELFYEIKYVAIEAIFRPLQYYVVQISDITQNGNSMIYIVCIKYISTISLFLISYFTDIMKSMNYMIIAQATIDASAVLPYILLVIKFDKLRAKITELEKIQSVENAVNDLASEQPSKSYREGVQQIEPMKPMPLGSICIGRQESGMFFEKSSENTSEKRTKSTSGIFENQVQSQSFQLMNNSNPQNSSEKVDSGTK